MTGVRISALPPIVAALLTDIFPVVQAGVTSKETLQQVLTLFDANIQLGSPSQVTGLGTAATKGATDNTQPLVTSIFGPTVVNNLAAFHDILGTVTDSGIAKANVALLTGAIFSGTVTLNGTQVNPNDAATIGFVNSVATGLKIVAAAFAATTTNLTATYNNGSAGVGATLTNSGTQATFTVDGITPAVNSRILVKNQTTMADNGIYSLTNVGSGSTNWVLTRTTDYDTPSQIVPGTLVLVQNGATQALTSWLETLTVTTVGTDPIQFTQFSASPAQLGQAAFKNVTDNTQPLVVSIAGATTPGDIAIFNDTTGTITDGGAGNQFLRVANNLSDVASLTISALNLFVTQIINSNTNIAPADYGQTFIMQGSSSYTVTLTGNSAGKFVRLSCQTTSNAIVTVVASSGLIAGQANIKLGSGDTILLYDDGTNFQILDSAIQPVNFLAYLSTNQSIPSGVPPGTKIHCDTVTRNIGAFYDGVTNFRFTPLLPGLYEINCSGLFEQANSPGTSQELDIVLNGTTSVAKDFHVLLPSGFWATMMNPSIQLFLNGVTDFVEIFALQNTGVPLLLDANNYTMFCGTRVSLF